MDSHTTHTPPSCSSSHLETDSGDNESWLRNVSKSLFSILCIFFEPFISATYTISELCKDRIETISQNDNEKKSRYTKLITFKNTEDLLFSILLYFIYIFYHDKNTQIISIIIISIMITISIYKSYLHTYIYLAQTFLKIIVLYHTIFYNLTFLCWYILWRCSEVSISFLGDVQDKTSNKSSKSTIDARDRINLAIKSYIEFIFLFALIFSEPQYHRDKFTLHIITLNSYELTDTLQHFTKPIILSITNQSTFDFENKHNSEIKKIINNDFISFALIRMQRIVGFALLVITFTVYNNRAFYELSQKPNLEKCDTCEYYKKLTNCKIESDIKCPHSPQQP